MLLAILLIILLALCGGAASFDRWGAGYPVWGRDTLWLLAAICLAAIIVALVNR